MSSFVLSVTGNRNLAGPEHVDTKALPVRVGALQQAVVRSREPSRVRVFGKCQMQGVERAESESDQFARAIRRRVTGRYSKCRRPQPEARCQSPVLTRIPFIFQVMRGRAHEADAAALCGIENGCDCFSLASHPLLGGVVERSLEAGD